MSEYPNLALGALGCVPSVPDVRDYRMVAGAVREEALPTERKLALVPVKNQGSTSSCVAHAASSILEYNHWAEHDGQYVQFSTEWLYGYRPDSEGYYQGEGMMPRDCLKTMQKMGGVYNANLPGNHDYPTASANVTEHLEELVPLARPHKIYEYYRCATHADIKRAIFSGDPVLCSIPVRDRDHLDSNYCWVTDTSKQLSGAHALYIYGYNERGFLVQNSWGQLWGNKGRFVIPYETAEFYELWGVHDATDDEEDTTYIHRPFTGFLGRFFAKIFNWFLQLFSKKS